MSGEKLKDKVVIVTGGTSGIGRAGVLLFCAEGAKVVIGDIDKEGGEALLEEVRGGKAGEAIVVPSDISQPEQVEHLVNQTLDTHGRVDVLFGNAGILPLGTAWETSLEDWRRCIDVNLGGNFYLAKYGVPAVIEAGGGVIVFTASELGIVGTTGGVAYCASKAGLINMARALAIDCAPYGIRVNCIAPGSTRTPMTSFWLDQAEDPAALENEQIQPILLKRLGTAEEIARVALFLASEDSSYMTGSVVVADGGATAWYGI